MNSETAHDPVFRLHHRFWRTTDDDGGQVLHVETRVEPGGGVTPHIHPTMEERFTVLSGRCQFLSGRRWIEAGEGEVVPVPPGTRHAFRNKGDADTTIVCEARPPETLQEFLTDVAALSRAGKLMRAGLPKPNGILEAAVLIEGYRDMCHFLAPAPPRPIQRVIFGPLARIAERRGMRPGHLAQVG